MSGRRRCTKKHTEYSNSPATSLRSRIEPTPRAALVAGQSGERIRIEQPYRTTRVESESDNGALTSHQPSQRTLSELPCACRFNCPFLIFGVICTHNAPGVSFVDKVRPVTHSAPLTRTPALPSSLGHVSPLQVCSLTRPHPETTRVVSSRCHYLKLCLTVPTVTRLSHFPLFALCQVTRIGKCQCTVIDK